MNIQRIKKLVIAGGGTAGWMTAASLAKHFKGSELEISLVESSTIGTIGVGEATIPTIRRFYAELGLSDAEVLKATSGTCKLGIQFLDWNKKGDGYFHPFGLFGQDIKHVGFQHFWTKMSSFGDIGSISDFSLATQLALRNKFTPPSPKPPNSLSVFDWALHFDASQFAQLMKTTAIYLGVKHIDAVIEKVVLRASDGFIDALALSNGQKLDGDLFIDCTGFAGLLIEQALNTGYEDWSEWLKCDRAVAVQSTSGMSDIEPYTSSRAQSAGWQWSIPLQNRRGNGHVYSSQYMSDDEACSVLKNNLIGEIVGEPKLIKFKAGRRLKAWNKNCVAIGLSSGFIEPLESTSIAFIENGILRLKMLFPDAEINSRCVDEYNEMSRLEYEGCRDFIVLHYKASSRDDSQFWRDCRNMSVPERLQHKLEVYRARGHIVKYRWEIFQNPSWIAIYHGNGILPQSYDMMVDNFDHNYLTKAFQEMRHSIVKAVEDAPTHKDFLRMNAL